MGNQHGSQTVNPWVVSGNRFETRWGNQGEHAVSLADLRSHDPHGGRGPKIGQRVSATKYLHAVQNRWARRTSENEGERQRLIMEARELIRASWHASEVEDRAKYYTIILKAQERLAKLYGLDAKKVGISGNIDILERREETIALLTPSAKANSIRNILQSISPANETEHQDLSPQPSPIALPHSESENS